jgi:uncharacterized protein (DUF924 family)
MLLQLLSLPKLEVRILTVHQMKQDFYFDTQCRNLFRDATEPTSKNQLTQWQPFPDNPLSPKIHGLLQINIVAQLVR